LPTLPTKKNASFSIQRFSTKEKGKVQIHLIELMREERKKTFMGLEKNFKIPEDVVNVMIQTKRLLENIIHLNTNIKRFKEMAKALNFFKKR
jgi:hypothetical protein